MALPSIPLLLLSCVCLLYAELHMMAVLYTLVGFTASANSILLILLVLRMNVRIARLSGMGMLMMPTLRSSLVPAFGMAGHIAVAKKWEMALEMRDKLQNPATVCGYLRDLDVLLMVCSGRVLKTPGGLNQTQSPRARLQPRRLAQQPRRLAAAGRATKHNHHKHGTKRAQCGSSATFSACAGKTLAKTFYSGFPPAVEGYKAPQIPGAGENFPPPPFWTGGEVFASCTRLYALCSLPLVVFEARRTYVLLPPSLCMRLWPPLLVTTADSS
jgi:hypothetical protein